MGEMGREGAPDSEHAQVLRDAGRARPEDVLFSTDDLPYVPNGQVIPGKAASAEESFSPGAPGTPHGAGHRHEQTPERGHTKYAVKATRSRVQRYNISNT